MLAPCFGYQTGHLVVSFGVIAWVQFLVWRNRNWGSALSFEVTETGGHLSSWHDREGDSRGQVSRWQVWGGDTGSPGGLE